MLEILNAWDFRGRETLKFDELPIQIQRRLGNLSNFWQILTYEGEAPVTWWESIRMLFWLFKNDVSWVNWLTRFTPGWAKSTLEALGLNTHASEDLKTAYGLKTPYGRMERAMFYELYAKLGFEIPLADEISREIGTSSLRLIRLFLRGLPNNSFNVNCWHAFYDDWL